MEHVGVQVGVGFTLILALEDLQGGRSLASMAGGQGLTHGQVQSVYSSSPKTELEGSVREARERQLCWPLGLWWSLLPASDGSPRPGEPGEFSAEEAEQQRRQETDRLRAGGTGPGAVLWGFRS